MGCAYKRLKKTIRRGKYTKIYSMIPETPTLSRQIYLDNEAGIKEVYPRNTTIMFSRALSHGVRRGVLERSWPDRVPEWFKELKTVSRWSAQLQGSNMKHPEKKTYDSSTRRQYIQSLWNFNRWLQGRKFEIQECLVGRGGTYTLQKRSRGFKTPEDMLELLDRPMSDPKHMARIVKDFLLDENGGASGSQVMMYKNALVSYFEKNEQPLKLAFKQVRYRPHEQSMDLGQMRAFAEACPTMERAMFMCKFQRGMDVSTLVDSFNHEGRRLLTEQLGDNPAKWDLGACPVPLVLTRVKTRFAHTGFLDRDAVSCLQKHLRKSREGPLFVNKFGRPITRSWIFQSFASIANKAGIRQKTLVDGRTRYNLDSHEMRDLLKSTLIDSGCRVDIADHVMGHMPKDSYEKQTKLYPDTLRKEYAKASARLNVLSGEGPAPPTSAEGLLDKYDEALSDIRSRVSELETLGKAVRELYAGR